MEARPGHSYQEALLAPNPHDHVQINELVILGPTPASLLGTWAEVTLGHLVTFVHCCLTAKKVGRSSLHTSVHNEQEKVKYILKKIF